MRTKPITFLTILTSVILTAPTVFSSQNINTSSILGEVISEVDLVNTVPVTKTVVYSMPGCLSCYEAKMLLKKANIDYEEISVEQDPELRKKLAAENGGWDTFPMIFIDNKFVGGYEELKDLYDAGELGNILG